MEYHPKHHTQRHPDQDGEPPGASKGSPESSLTPHKPTARSCYACRERKIRCNKTQPCTPCARIGKQCTYPPEGPRVRRTRKAIMTDMTARIASLEKSLAKATSQESTDRAAVRSRRNRADRLTSSAYISPDTGSKGTPESSQGQDILVEKGSSSQYFNEVVLSRFIEREKGIETVLTTPQASSPNAPAAPHINALGILSAPNLAQPPHSFHPPKQLAMRLWDTYVNSVEGCLGLKVLHLPTDEIKVYSTIDQPETASLDDQALCLACYFAAVTSIEDSEALTVLGRERSHYLTSLKSGLEQAFAQANFLGYPTFTGLRALAIYLSALRVHDHGKAMWILNGLAIRIAQSLGCHRNGEKLGLPPFQSEMRRRLWWHLITRDSRAGEDYGIENIRDVSVVSEVSPPLNIEDSDIYPGITELPPARSRWTPMTFSLIHFDLVKMSHDLNIVSGESWKPCPMSEERRSQIVRDTRERIEDRLKACSPVIPRERLTIFCSRFLLRKLDFISRQQQFFMQSSKSIDDFATEENLVEALAILESRLFQDDELLKQYTYANKAYPQYQMTMYVLGHLCFKPEGPSVERAWKMVNRLFHQEPELCFPPGDMGPKWAVLGVLKAKAEYVRKKSRSEAEEVHENVRQQAAPRTPATGLPPSSPPLSNIQSAYLLGSLVGDEIDAGFGNSEWPTSWVSLVQGLDPDSQFISDMFWQ